MEESVGEEEARRLEIENQVVRINIHVLGFYRDLISPPDSVPPYHLVMYGYMHEPK